MKDKLAKKMHLILLELKVIVNKWIGFAFLETSAKDSSNVKLAFESLAKEIYKNIVEPYIKEKKFKKQVEKLSKAIKVDVEDENDKVVLRSSTKKKKEKNCC